MSKQFPSLSIILPAKDEAAALPGVLSGLRKLYPQAELLVVDDGSTDGTAKMAAKHGARVVSHPYAMGNGAAIKSGARAAGGDILVFMDADGQHNPDDVARLLERLTQGFDMVVGARTRGSQASLGRGFANGIYNLLASWMVGHRIPDLTSGLRAVRANLFREFIHLLPNTFSYPTTSTMAFFRAGYSVAYVPIAASRRIGKSHIRPLRDGVRFLLIIFKVATLYAPLKIFLPISLVFFLLGLGWYVHTYLSTHHFTVMSALLFVTAVLIFLIGLISEQITNLLFIRGNKS
ncbi:MAG TPA: glycosyltransferase family 2 protein [Gammaproteobacteria bacterium]|nr:glycosyltransferase family 2 protein [Gammaproteobacteria bacterium]